MPAQVAVCGCKQGGCHCFGGLLGSPGVATGKHVLHAVSGGLFAAELWVVITGVNHPVAFKLIGTCAQVDGQAVLVVTAVFGIQGRSQCTHVGPSPCLWCQQHFGVDENSAWGVFPGTAQTVLAFVGGGTSVDGAVAEYVTIILLCLGAGCNDDVGVAALFEVEQAAFEENVAVATDEINGSVNGAILKVVPGAAGYLCVLAPQHPHILIGCPFASCVDGYANPIGQTQRVFEGEVFAIEVGCRNFYYGIGYAFPLSGNDYSVSAFPNQRHPRFVGREFQDFVVGAVLNQNVEACRVVLGHGGKGFSNGVSYLAGYRSGLGIYQKIETLGRYIRSWHGGKAQRGAGKGVAT